MPKFSFDPIRHVYTVDSRELVSVTQCLPKSPFMKNNEEARLKGEYVHSMCRLYLLNDLQEDTLSPALVPYLDALKKFLSDSKGMGIQGVIDIKSGVKTSTVELQISAYIELINNGIPFNGIPLKAPVMSLEEPFFHPVHRFAGTPDIVLGDLPVKEGFALYLKSNGKYSLDPIKNTRRNFEIFLCFLNTKRWMLDKNIME